MRMYICEIMVLWCFEVVELWYYTFELYAWQSFKAKTRVPVPRFARRLSPSPRLPVFTPLDDLPSRCLASLEN